MKIAIPTKNNMVFGHFGQCAEYRIYRVENQLITEESTITTESVCGCKSGLASKLRNMGVSVLLAGNIGQGAFENLNKAGIKVFRGNSGKVNDVINNYISGNITDSGQLCMDHEHNCHK